MSMLINKYQVNVLSNNYIVLLTTLLDLTFYSLRHVNLLRQNQDLENCKYIHYKSKEFTHFSLFSSIFWRRNIIMQSFKTTITSFLHQEKNSTHKMQNSFQKRQELLTSMRKTNNMGNLYKYRTSINDFCSSESQNSTTTEKHNTKQSSVRP